MILLLDNYDSFTWNLYDHLCQTGADVTIHRNDAITLNEIGALQPEAIVISPGPETPLQAGITMQVIDRFHASVPMLGVCLGYQAIGMYFGARLERSPVPVHGKTSMISHSGQDLFAGLPDTMQVMRYHSLNIADVPAQLEITAVTDRAEPMALRHRELPLWGVQFHPESILTPDGLTLLHNWRNLYR
ncbi:MAG: aminodeoxychorismate/anthranilate synthase component II [Chitinophagales bacterium]|nr:aminodeoxychorismate/anthranilate synthase component II [Chitinophagales bacterium]HAE14429.1 anthranilate/aminodeoxychorismate synthase component II [Bacteroidota bacterium]MCB9022150.1 aminodeoxychorismate/anthranilate synthase component II [Chitinophagales bacterium]MCB9031951.1 aminodeoxychorismate/anthranilate synthase component II [Chitinophagales bacterium]HPE97624.1 aminodeoxychorismate/anthranilate synthase component II [Chitinophagales bacterium]